MKFKFKWLLVLFSALVIFISCGTRITSGEGFEKVVLNKVIDGDTIKISIDQKLENVRFLLVDSPELKQNQPYAKEAKNFIEKKLSDKQYVYLEYDVEKRDKYDRILAYVWYEEDGEFKMLNQDIVEEGLARVGYVYDSKKHLDMLKSSEDRAKKDKVNIWSIEGYVTEKGYKN